MAGQNRSDERERKRDLDATTYEQAPLAGRIDSRRISTVPPKLNREAFS
jgi:hypothetical protein